MGRRVAAVAILLISAAWAGDGKAAQQAAAQPGNTGSANSSQDLLTNDSITKMVKAGLSDTVIINMVSTQPGKYSLNPEDVIALKGAGVSENIISAMLKASASTPPAPVPAPAGTVAAAAPVTEVGVYLKQKDAWVQMMSEVVNWKTGGVLKTIGSAGVVKPDVNGRLNGETSRYSVGTPVDFLIYVPEGVEITEYQLVHLHRHSDGREFRTMTGGVFHQSGGAMRDTMPFDYKKSAARTYLVSLSGIKAGEYGFLSPGAVLASHASAQLGKMYTFRVIE